jgi:hypothetical protein
VNADEDSTSDEQELDDVLARLEAREREVSSLRRKLHDRLASFPNNATVEREKALSRERRELHVEIDALRARRSAMRLERADADADDD